MVAVSAQPTGSHAGTHNLLSAYRKAFETCLSNLIIPKRCVDTAQLHYWLEIRAQGALKYTYEA